tara:strand:- start:1004 stop:1204 length:201 start_codon:yes stop_codon:yes gene_type:complete
MISLLKSFLRKKQKFHIYFLVTTIMDDFIKPDASPASTPTPKQPDQNQQTDFFAAGTRFLALFVVV